MDVLRKCKKTKHGLSLIIFFYPLFTMLPRGVQIKPYKDPLVQIEQKME